MLRELVAQYAVLGNRSEFRIGELQAEMERQGGWIGQPACLGNGKVWDGNHRITAATRLGWWSLDVPVE